MKRVKGLVLAGIVASVGTAVMVTAGPLNPPGGPVGSTHKTLNEIEPRIPIQSLSGDSSAQFIITQPGSYYLTGNIIGNVLRHAISVQGGVADVTNDLCGFELDGQGIGAVAVLNVAEFTCFLQEFAAGCP